MKFLDLFADFFSPVVLTPADGSMIGPLVAEISPCGGFCEEHEEELGILVVGCPSKE